MKDDCVKRDLFASVRTITLFWLLPIATINITGYFAHADWVLAVGWTLSLLVMGVACVVNTRGCGRMHCYFTGPFFLLMALVTVLHGMHLLPLGHNGWKIIGDSLLIGGVLLCVVPELLWGRYRSVRRNPEADC